MSYPVRECLLIVLNEEWHHRLYAERGLQFLGKLRINRASAVNSAEYYQLAAESYREAAEIADRRGDAFAADEWSRAANWAEGQSSTAQGAVD